MLSVAMPGDMYGFLVTSGESNASKSCSVKSKCTVTCTVIHAAYVQVLQQVQQATQFSEPSFKGKVATYMYISNNQGADTKSFFITYESSHAGRVMTVIS